MPGTGPACQAEKVSQAAYRKLSEQLADLAPGLDARAFVRRFRAAVRDGQVGAVLLPQRFSLPGESGGRRVSDMLFEVTPEFEYWFSATQDELTQDPGREPLPSQASLEANPEAFKRAARRTRQQLLARSGRPPKGG